MHKRLQLACYVTEDLAAAFRASAKARDLTIAAALRRLVVNEVFGVAFDPREQRNHLLFTVIALDGLLTVHPDPELRQRLIRLWQERVAREDQSHAA